jgi:hypothetical protein
MIPYFINLSDETVFIQVCVVLYAGGHDGYVLDCHYVILWRLIYRRIHFADLWPYSILCGAYAPII